MEKRNSGKYEYVPDVSRIMRQAEPVSAKAGRRASGRAEAAFVPEIFFYFKNDING